MKILFSDWLIQNDACEDAIDFVLNDCNNDVQKALETCPDPYWLSWLDEKFDWLLREGDPEFEVSYVEWNAGFITGAYAILDPTEDCSHNSQVRATIRDLYYQHVTPLAELKKQILDQNVLAKVVKKKATVVKKATKKTTRKGR